MTPLTSKERGTRYRVKEKEDDRYDKQKRDTPRPMNWTDSGEEARISSKLVHWRFWERSQLGQEALHCAL
jgi:hypothetical protein